MVSVCGSVAPVHFKQIRVAPFLFSSIKDGVVFALIANVLVDVALQDLK